MWRWSSAILLAASLAGCVTAEEQARQVALQDSKCRSYGAVPGSSAYVQCRAQLDAAQTQAQATLDAVPPAPGIVYPR